MIIIELSVKSCFESQIIFGTRTINKNWNLKIISEKYIDKFDFELTH